MSETRKLIDCHTVHTEHILQPSHTRTHAHTRAHTFTGAALALARFASGFALNTDGLRHRTPLLRPRSVARQAPVGVAGRAYIPAL